MSFGYIMYSRKEIVILASNWLSWLAKCITHVVWNTLAQNGINDVVMFVLKISSLDVWMQINKALHWLILLSKLSLSLGDYVKKGIY